MNIYKNSDNFISVIISKSRKLCILKPGYSHNPYLSFICSPKNFKFSNRNNAIIPVIINDYQSGVANLIELNKFLDTTDLDIIDLR